MSGTYPCNAQPSRRSLWLPLAVAAVLVAVFAGAWLLAGAAAAAYPYWWSPFPWFFFVPAFFLLFFGLRWFLWGGWGWGWYRGGYGDPAVETLRERFARGEITKEQFDSMMRDLQASGK